MSAGSDQVTLTIDGRAVTVAAGTGLVEAALHAGVEIPVFCYEPRLGPPVGAGASTGGTTEVQSSGMADGSLSPIDPFDPLG